MEILKKENGIFTFQKDKNNFINFCPARGGLITKWVSNNRQILYFDEERFKDQSKSIRGGIPILFPICGSFENHSLFGENCEDLMQHGFARDQNWNFKFNQTKNILCLTLNDNAITRKYYPFIFEIKIELTLDAETLIFEIEVFNKSQSIMPMNFGLHPYFNISDLNKIEFIEYPINCQNQKNNSIERTKDLLKNISQGIDFLMYSSGKTIFKDFGLKRKITLIHPFPFDISVIWSDPPRKMICMEPWTSPRNSLKNGIRKIEILPNSSQKLLTLIKIDKI